MAGKIIIERLEFQGHCGVTPEERKRPQPLAVDLELECQTEPAATSDDIHSAIDYAQIADRVLAVGATQHCALLETFAEHLLTMLFSEFPIEKAKIWLRKLAPPLKHVTGSVGVQLERSRLLHHIQDAGPTPARFLTQQLHRLPKGKALDVAAGSGRNAHRAFTSMR
jgi:dihydroneopterin aldolase